MVYVWAQELVPQSAITNVTVSLSTFDSGSLAFICTYFLLISKDWFPLMLTSVLMTLVAFIGCFFLPESPNWLLANGRVQEAIDAFNYIGRVNGVKKVIPPVTHFHEAQEPNHTASRLQQHQANETTHDFPTNISKLVANNLSMHSMH